MGKKSIETFVGIFVLLGVTAGVLGCFARFFVMLARRAKNHD